MQLTVEQALQQGIAAHKNGDLPYAERFYRAILKSQPAHAHANHNLGVLKVSQNLAGAALPLFQIALKANPNIEQFWLSYIGALIQEKQVEEASEALSQANKHGVSFEKAKILEQKILSLKPELPPVLSEKRNRAPFPKTHNKTAGTKKNQIRKKNAKGDSPPRNQILCLSEYYKQGKFTDAEKLCVRLTREFPKFQLGWKVLGVLYEQSGRNSEALRVNQTITRLCPEDADAHNNLGNTQKKLAKIHEAISSYTQAISLKPDFAEAHNNLGVAFKELGEMEDALACYEKAIFLKPDYAEAYSNLGVAFKKIGRIDEALASYTRAIALKPEFSNAYVNLGIAMKNIRFNSPNREIYPAIISLLNTNFTRPSNIAESTLSLLKQDPLMKELLREDKSSISIKKVYEIIDSLERLPLLHQLMQVCPLPDLQIERLFVKMRSTILKNLDQIEASPGVIHFLSTLSLQCFTNEYVYEEKAEETHKIDSLEAEISQTIARSKPPQVTKVLCLAAYRYVHKYDWCQKLETLDHLTEIKLRLIEEPNREKMIADNIPVFKEISDNVSREVRKQYEESPYPRWVKLGVPSNAKTIEEVCADLKLKLHFESIKTITTPTILIAGCGTGQHSIGTASRFADCDVTAVDLSLASLAYAKRKTVELGISNIEYMQADILQLADYKQKFDVVESAGVLHHMGEPLAGWRILVDLLKPGGLMQIGLYSDLARHCIAEIRKEIALLQVGTSESEIRQFRQSISKSSHDNHKHLVKLSDFYSLSMLRDLIFHVQEHRFTLLQIKNYLDELGLKFCGFQNKVPILDFKKFHGKDADIYNLELWHSFEQNSPQTFIEMYQFWCQKSIASVNL